MTIKISLLEDDAIEEYDVFLSRQASGLFYHSSRFKDFLSDLLGCEPRYLLSREEGRLKGVLPLIYFHKEGRRVVNSLAYYGSNGGILAESDASAKALAKAYNAIASDRKTISSTFISNPFDEKDHPDIIHNYLDYRIGQFTPLVGPENPWDELMSRFHSSARRNIKKAQREGIVVDVCDNRLEYIQKMHQTNIRAIGGMAKSDRFFDLIPRHFTAGKDYDLYVASKDDQIVSGLLLFYFNQVVEYYTPAVVAEFRSLQPLSLIIITAMIDACRRGLKWWNWGGTWATQEGVYKFKRKWAAIEKKYYYYTQLNDPSLLSKSREEILEAFPSFYIIPFSALDSKEGREDS